jgi:hypothetical protein
MEGTTGRERRAAKALIGALEQLLGELAGAKAIAALHDRALVTRWTAAARHTLIRWAA